MSECWDRRIPDGRLVSGVDVSLSVNGMLMQVLAISMDEKSTTLVGSLLMP